MVQGEENYFYCALNRKTMDIYFDPVIAFLGLLPKKVIRDTEKMFHKATPTASERPRFPVINTLHQVKPRANYRSVLTVLSGLSFSPATATVSLSRRDSLRHRVTP